MALSDDFIYRLRAENPIEDVFGSYTLLRRQGSNFKCLCPFHSERTPSFTSEWEEVRFVLLVILYIKL